MSVAPIKVLDRGFRIWGEDDVYTGPEGVGRNVPNVKDLICVVEGSRVSFRLVTDLDQTTNLHTTTAAELTDTPVGVIPNDILLASGPGAQEGSFNVFINTSVVPHTMKLDGRLRMHGSHITHYRVFRNSDTDPDGVVVSMRLDGQGNIIDNKLPMEVVQTAAGNNVAVKSPVPGHCIETLPANEIVTVVFYGADGEAVSSARLIVRRSNSIMSGGLARRYVTSIELISDRLSESDAKTLEYPINMLVQSAVMRARINYSDGSHDIRLIDGERVEFHGLSSYQPTVIGKTAPLLLTYYLADNEYAIDGNGILEDRFVSETYDVRAIDVVGAYTVKLFPVPVWVTATTSYQLKWFLYNLDRDEVYDVTALVTLVEPNASYNGFPTGNPQTITAQIELSTVGASYGHYIHSQTFRLALLTNGTASGANWWLEHTVNGTQYGGAAKAMFTNMGAGVWDLDIAAGKATVGEWLDALYYAAEPLQHPTSEVNAPVPTHVRLELNGVFIREIAVVDYATPVTNINLAAPNPNRGDALLLKFIKREGPTDLQVGIGAMSVGHTV